MTECQYVIPSAAQLHAWPRERSALEANPRDVREVKKLTPPEIDWSFLQTWGLPYGCRTYTANGFVTKPQEHNREVLDPYLKKIYHELSRVWNMEGIRNRVETLIDLREGKGRDPVLFESLYDDVFNDVFLYLHTQARHLKGKSSVYFYVVIRNCLSKFISRGAKSVRQHVMTVDDLIGDESPELDEEENIISTSVRFTEPITSGSDEREAFAFSRLVHELTSEFAEYDEVIAECVSLAGLGEETDEELAALQARYEVVPGYVPIRKALTVRGVPPSSATRLVNRIKTFFEARSPATAAAVA
jgi:hypothetical protein